MAFKLNPGFLAAFEKSAELQAVKVAAGEGVAAVAQRLAHQVDPDYETSVQVKGTKVQVVGHGPHINPAARIEFGTGGTTPTPPYAPLRRAAQAMGLSLKASKK